MMYNPCFECLNRYGHSYTEECDNSCKYAYELKKLKPYGGIDEVVKVMKGEVKKLQRCKYLDDLGLKVEEYGTNFTDTNDSRIDKWDEQCKQYGFDERETWNLDRTFIEWIYTRFTMYKEICIVNTDYHKISYKDEEITQGEAIDKVLNLSQEILQKGDSVWNEGTNKMVFENSREICEILKELLPYMWW